MNAAKKSEAEPKANPRLEAERRETDRLLARTRSDSERRAELETDKTEAHTEALESYSASITDESAVGDVDVRAEGALPADRVIGVSSKNVDKKARALQVEATMDNKRAEAANRRASTYPFVDGNTEADARFKPMYDASARDPAAVNNSEAARVPNASHTVFTPFEYDDEDDDQIPAKTQEEMRAGSERLSGRGGRRRRTKAEQAEAKA